MRAASQREPRTQRSTPRTRRRATSRKGSKSASTGTKARFAEGVEDVEHHPEDEKKGDFAEGIEEEDG